MPETSFTAASLMMSGPVGVWIAVGWAVTASVMAIGFGRAAKLGETEEDRRLADLDEAAGLYAQALVRQDTRAMKSAADALVDAKCAVLAAELGRKWH